MKRRKKMSDRIKQSPINYFSDLFIVAMVVIWLIAVFIMMVMAIYSTIVLKEVSMWSEVGTLVAVPLSCGGAIWMIKNSVQHAIMNKNGETCPHDFPAVNADGESDGFEEPMTESDENTDE